MGHPEIDGLLEQMPAAFQAASAEGLDVVLQFNLTGEKSGEFNLKIKDGQCTSAAGTHDSPTTTFKAEGTDWLDLLGGKADGMSLYMAGKLSIDGDMSIAMQLNSLFKQP